VGYKEQTPSQRAITPHRRWVRQTIGATLNSDTILRQKLREKIGATVCSGGSRPRPRRGYSAALDDLDLQAAPFNW